MRSRSLVAAPLLAAALAFPAAANAVSVTVTDDAGQPTPLTEGSAFSMRNMAPVIAPTFAADEKRFSLTVTDPAGKVQVSSVSCGDTANSDATREVTYEGNGTYTLKFDTFANPDDTGCEQAPKTQTFTFTINASTTLTPPATTLLYRTSGLGYEEPPFKHDMNPGAIGYTLHFGFNASVGPDGDLIGDFKRKEDYGIVNDGGPPNGQFDVDFQRAGIVSVIARPETLQSSGPWSAPITLTVVSPFDWADSPGLKDSRGPKYSIAGMVSEPLATGTPITLSMAKGKKGKFKKVSTVKIGADRGFLFKFKAKGKGSWRVRYAYSGSKFMTAGVWSAKFTVKKRSVGLTGLKHVRGD
jgi:hypothetical protein